MKPPAAPEPKPLLRGWIHEVAFFVALVGAALLIAHAHGRRAAAGALVYSISLVLLLGASALYHRGRWSRAEAAWLQRLDHSSIFVLIAGTWTPLCLTIQRSRPALAVAWIGAGLGVAQSVFFTRVPRWVVAVAAVLLGWACVPFLGQIASSAGFSGTLLLILGGVLYTVGAVVYALRRPDPAPSIFGFHEVFHVFVVLAAACHFAAVAEVTVR